MHSYAEEKLLNAIGRFSTTAVLFRNTSGFNYHEILVRNNEDTIFETILPGQCQAFLNSSVEQVWFIEEYFIDGDNLTDKKIFPAKITGLDLPLLSGSTGSVNLRWREGLVRWGNVSNSPVNYDSQTGNFRPGFGQLILQDLERPLKEVIVPINNLGMAINKSNQDNFSGTGGRLFSMAFHVNTEEAAKYEKSKKKRKSLNSQDYEMEPTYPAYIPTSPGGYYG